MKRISIVYIVNSLIRTMCIGRTLNQHLQLSIETIPLFENRNRQIEKGSLSLEYVAPSANLPHSHFLQEEGNHTRLNKMQSN